MMQPMSKFDYSDLDGHLLQLLVAVEGRISCKQFNADVV